MYEWIVQYLDGRRGALWHGSPNGSTAMQWRRSGVPAAFPFEAALAIGLAALACEGFDFAAFLAGFAARERAAGRGGRDEFFFDADLAFLPRTRLMQGSA